MGSGADLVKIGQGKYLRGGTNAVNEKMIWYLSQCFFMDLPMQPQSEYEVQERLGPGYRTAAPFEIGMANGGRACVITLQSVNIFRTRFTYFAT